MRRRVMSHEILSLGIWVALLTAPVFSASYGTEIGVPPHGETAFELIAKSEQNGSDFAAYGYLTHVFGLSDELAFSSPTVRSEATARFTFSGKLTRPVRETMRSNLIVNVATGTVTFYFNQAPKGNFDDPASFSAGAPIGTALARFQIINNVQAPTVGIITSVADLTQLTVNPFVLGGQQCLLGHVGLVERLFATGMGMLTEPTTPRAFSNLAGHVVVTGR